MIFADDTSLIFKLKRQFLKYDEVNNAISKLVNWFNANNLYLNGIFLGITLDAKLQWGPHISKLASKLNSEAYAVKKIRSLTSIETARLAYF